MSVGEVDKDDLAAMAEVAATLTEAFRDDPFFRFLFDADPDAPWSSLPPDIKVGYRVLFEAWLKRNTRRNAQIYAIGSSHEAVVLFIDLAKTDYPPDTPLSFADALVAGQIQLPQPCIHRFTQVFLPLAMSHENLMSVRMGWSSVTPADHSISHTNALKINLIGVRNTSRGLGYSKRLTEHVLQIARARGRQGIYLNTMRAANVGLYEHFGFQPVVQYTIEEFDDELSHGDTRYPDAKVTNWLMARSLEDPRLTG